MKKLLFAAMSLLIVLTMLFSFSTGAFAENAVLAFPEADGAGKYTVGGRGGRVIEVTTLEDGQNIPGSFRAAIEQASGPRIVVFKVAGTIVLKDAIRIVNPYITIAGQTAPGDGITLKDYELYVKANQVIIRNIRVRLGDLLEKDAMSVSDVENVIIDHCSVSWGVDETLSVTGCDKVTVQWTFITEGLHYSVHHYGKHSKGSLVNGSRGQTVTFNHDLYAHNDARNPRAQGKTTPEEDPLGFYFDLTNSVIYDWGRAYAVKNLDDDTLCTINLINNYFIPGPSSEANNFMIDKNINSRLYFSGNVMNGKMPSDQYSLITYEDFVKPDNGWKLAAPFENDNDHVQSAEKAYAMVMKNGGAALSRDAYDKRIVNEVITGTGRVIDKPSDVGGWPVLNAGEAYTDTDKDGMPDSWETAHGLDPNNAADGSLDRDSDGYTNVEEFLNSLMAGLYTEDVPFPSFDSSHQKFRNVLYDILRNLIDVQKFFEKLFVSIGL